MNEAETEIVREIYSLFLTGLTPHTIAKRLTERGIKTPTGKDKWHSSTVKSIRAMHFCKRPTPPIF